MNILRAVTLDRINRKKDKSVSMTFITDTEQTSEQFMELDRELDQHGTLFFKTSGLLTDKEMNTIESVSVEKHGKSQSQKIRQRIWTLWNKSETDLNDDEFYHAETELILSYLDKKIQKL